MKKPIYKIRAKVWLYPGMAGWHFISLPKAKSKEIKELFPSNFRGFNSISVKVIVGQTTWKTSIFPDKKTSTYVMPLKAEVRKKENIEAGKTINITLEIRT